MKKKLLTILLAVVAMLSICIGISACDDKSVSSPDDNSQTEQPDDSHNGNQNNGDSQEQHKHVVGAWVEEIPAQCEEEGVLGHFECTTCHKYFDANMSELNTLTIPKLDHAWDNGKITKEATCIEPGVKTFTCQRDEKHQKTEVIQIDPKNHDYGDWIVQTDATCEAPGELGHYQCSFCHHYFDNELKEISDLTIRALGHAWDNGKITKEATCIEPGVKTFTCQRDEKHQKTEVIQIDPKNHDYGDWIVQTDATCEAPGELGHYQCSFCHHYFDNELKEISDLTIRALGHAWDNGIVTSEPTCSQQGEKYFTCTRDNSHHKTEKIAIDQDAHKWNDGEVTKPATCSAEGIKTYTCQYDKEHTRIETIEIDKDAHSYEDWVPQIDAECEKEGVLGHFRCEYCQLYFDIEHQPLDDLQIVPKGHLYMSQILSFGCEVGKFELKICERCQKSSCDRIEIPKAHSGVGICADCGLDFWEAYKNYFENNGVYSSIDDQYSISKFFYYSGNDFHCTWCYSNDNVITWLIDAYNGSTKQYTVTITIKPNSTICNWNLQIYISTTQTMRGTFDARNITEDIDMLPIDYCSPALNTPSYKQTFGGLAASLTGILLLYTRTNFMENPEGFNIEGFGFVNFGKPYVFHDFVVKSYSIPTSTQKGEIEFYCGLCNTTKKYQYEWDVQPSTEHIHQFGEWVEEIPATCDDEGRVGYHQCETCKKYYDADNQEITDFSIPALKHDWGTGVVTKKATCTEEGTIEYTCKHDPNHKYTEQISIDQDAHTFGQWVDKVDADCENAGHQGYYFCETCHKYYDVDRREIPDPIIPALQHEWDAGVVKREATCMEPGERYFTCSHDASHHKTESIVDPNAHEWNSGRITRESTCTLAGIKEYTCVHNPEHTKEETLELKPHPFVTTQDEYTHYDLCSACGLKQNEVAHTFTGGKTCSICQKTVNYSVNLLFQLNKNTFTLIGLGACSDTNIIIPDKVFDEASGNLYPVTAIGQSAFSAQAQLQIITLPNSIVSLGKNAFKGCSAEIIWGAEVAIAQISQFAFAGYIGKNLIIPSTVTEIGADAFNGCTAEISWETPPTSFSKRIFAGYAGDTISVPNTVRSIAAEAFSDCSSEIIWGTNPTVNLFEADAFKNYKGTQIEIPKSMSEILYPIFSGFTGEIVWGDLSSVARLGKNAFAYYAGTELAIPESVTSYESPLFEGCSNLQKLTIDSCPANFGSLFGTTKYSNSVPVSQSSTYYLPVGLNHIIIRGGTSIPANTFKNCSELTNIDFESDAITSVGSQAFYNCSSLVSIVIPNSVTSIGSDVFHGCSSLESMTVPFIGAKIKTDKEDYQSPFGYFFGTSSFEGGEETRQSYYQNSSHPSTPQIYYIPKTLKSVTVTGGNILYAAFSSCINLKEVKIQSTMCKSIAKSAFYECTGLAAVEIPNTVTSIENSAFYHCSSLVTAILPDRLVSIGDSAFCGCSALKSIYLPNTLTSIESSAFSGCAAEIVWGNEPQIEELGSSAFAGYKGEQIEIPHSVITIGNSAFSGCTNLTEIAIPENVASIGTSVFYGCASLEVVYWNAINCATASLAGQAPLFSGCSSLTQAIAGDHVQVIPQWAFRECTYLTNVTLPHITKLDNYAFYMCDSLENVDLGDQLKTIGEKAFYKCSSLRSIVIPNSVTSISSDVFNGCSALESMTVPFIGNKVKTDKDDYQVPFGYFFGWDSFAGAEETQQWYYSSASRPSYSNTYYIPKSLTSVTVTGGNILYGAFGHCANLKEIKIQSAICKSIGMSAFYGCTALTKVELPDNVTSIGDQAFYRCGALTSINLPLELTSVGGNAFYGCTSLKTIYWNAKNCAAGSSSSPIFKDCTSLTNVIIGENVKQIPQNSFYKVTLDKLFYCGTADQWQSVQIADTNLQSLDVYFYSNGYPYGESVTDGHFWHYNEATHEPEVWTKES